MAQKFLPLSIVTNGWLDIKKRSGTHAAFEFIPTPRMNLGISAHFELLSFKEAANMDFYSLPLEARSRIDNLLTAAEKISQQLSDEKPAGFATKIEALAEIQRLEKSIRHISEEYKTVPDKNVHICLFDSAKGKIAFKMNVDTGADLIGHAQKGRIVEIIHNKDGDIDKITVREPRMLRSPKVIKPKGFIK